ncbi:uncharacterized protein LOC112054845 [Bicyclus anynana]|uniref:Uncharacterized protein LOC112054845 n=1 Tax=Bicyclus anynana TaxID=110368 RepID=A0A6J1NS52_BICAN|nr:uncharacterized protein LOC112054845 [Bicyclus anynana]XP_023950540.1 uncharacterized protein LOC112054845 [Bicyclus anynana]
MATYRKKLFPPNIETWSDKQCLEISRTEMFPVIVKDLGVQKNIISRFLNFYLGGKVQKGLSPRDLIFAVISIMPISLTSEEFIWTESEYSEDGKLFFLTPDDKLKYEINSVINKRSDDNNENVSIAAEELTEAQDQLDDSHEKKIINIIKVDSNKENVTSDTHNQIKIETKSDAQKDLSSTMDEKSEVKPTLNKKPPGKCEGPLLWYRLKNDQPKNKNSSEEKIYTPADNVAFCIYFNRLLDHWDTDEQARISVKYFFAMAGLYLMRGKVKTCQNLTKYFATKFHSNLPCQVSTTPHKDFVKKSWKCFRENDNKTAIMFAKLVILSFVNSNRLDKYEKTNIIRFAVLSHTAYSEMGIINMFQQLASQTSNSEQFWLLFENMYTEQTAVSWNNVNDFFKKYLCYNGTHHWAGIISSKTFAHLSCSSNYELAVVVAVFIEKLTNNVGVWQSAWVSKGRNLEECKQLGYEIYKKYIEIDKDVEISKRSFYPLFKLILDLDKLEIHDHKPDFEELEIRDDKPD